MMIAGTIVILAGMKAASVILVPFLLSAFIAIISSPAVFWLQRRGVPTVVALFIVVVLILGLGSLLVALVGQSVKDFSLNLPLYQAKIKQQYTFVLEWLSTLGVDTSSVVLADTFDPGAAMKLAGTMLNSVGNVLTNGFLILMTVIFMLLEAAGLPTKMQAILETPDTSLPRMTGFLDDLKQYIAIKTGMSLATGVLVFIWLSILKVDYPIMWGVLAFALNYVPNIGSIIAAIPAVLLALVQLGVAKALIAAGGYVVVNVLMGSILEPRLMGRGLGLSTLVVFLSLLFWGWLLGPVGMLLSVPLTITAKIALDSRDDTQWLAVMLGPDKAVRGDKKPEDNEKKLSRDCEQACESSKDIGQEDDDSRDDESRKASLKDTPS